MKRISKPSLLYYCISSIISAGIIFLLIQGFNWPVGAEIIIAITLFIHSLVLARSAKDIFLAAQEKGLLTEWFLQLQHGYDISESNSESEI